MKTHLMNENYKSDWVNNLLMSRGVAEVNLDNIKHPTEALLEDYHDLVNIMDAAAYIYNSLLDKKKFGMIIDSDVDGTTSATIMYHFLHELDPDINIQYTFHKGKQHGLEDCWEDFIKMGVDIVLEMDAGVNDKKYHDLLGDAGIFTVVGDHHNYEDVGYSEYAICVDNQTSPLYFNKSLAGCGISWRICQAMDELANTHYADKYIDLVALGCAADVMSPLSLENRFIFDYGYSHIQDRAFKALCDKQAFSMKGVVDYTSVAFYIAPLINACMRTGTTEEKALMYRMFLEPDAVVISGKRGSTGEEVSILEECPRVLTNVKARQQRLLDKYEDTFSTRISSYGLDENNIIVLHLEDEDTFDSELNGLIAMKFAGKTNKPCLVIRDGYDNLTKGSMRNPNGCPVAELKPLLEECPYVEWVFGHNNAAGVAIQTPHLDDFVKWFNERTADLNFNENCYQVNFDIAATDGYLDDLCWDIANNNKLWGGDNPQPIVHLKNIRIATNRMSFMGQKKDTVKFNVNGVDCMIFRNPGIVEKWGQLNDNIILECIGRPAINEFMGKTSIQLMIDDFDWHQDSILDF